MEERDAEGGATVAEKFTVEEQRPELFAQLDETQRNAVRQSLASAWHEGWQPDREEELGAHRGGAERR